MDEEKNVVKVVKETMPVVDEGSIGIGILLGFFMGLSGIIVALAIGKPLTTKGSVIGFCIALGLAFVVFCCYFSFLFGLIGSL